MQTPGSVYVPASREYPRQVPEPEYPASMLVRPVHARGQFRWKRHEVFVSEVLWGERIGLLPRDQRWYTVYFAHLPLGSFDSWQRRVLPLPKAAGFYMAEAGDREEFPAGYSLAGCSPAEPASASPTVSDSQQSTLPYNAFSANGDNPLNLLSQPEGAL